MNKKKLIIRCCIAVCCLTVLMFTILFAAGTFDPHNKYDSLKINGAAMSKLKKFCPPSDTQIIIKIPDFDLIKYMSQNDSIIDAFEAYENMRKTYLNYNEMDNYMYYYYDSATEDLKYLAISSALLSTATAEKCRLTDGDSYTPLHCRLCRIMLNAEKVLNLFLTDIKVKHTFIFRDAGGYFTIYFITNKGDYALYRIYETKFDPNSARTDYLLPAELFFQKLREDENNPHVPGNTSSVFSGYDYRPSMDWAKEYIVELPDEF